MVFQISLLHYAEETRVLTHEKQGANYERKLSLYKGERLPP